MPRYVDSEVDMQQSVVMLFYLAKKHGMCGDTAAEELKCQEVVMQAYDAMFHWSGIFTVNLVRGKPADYHEWQRPVIEALSR